MYIFMYFDVTTYGLTYHKTICLYAQEKQWLLHIAAGKGHVSVVEALIKSKADLNAVENVSRVK